MKAGFHAALVCIALVALSLPAVAYVIQGEDIPLSSDWARKTLTSSFLGNAVTGVPGASNGGKALSVVDNDNSKKLDIHTIGNTEDLLYLTTAAGALNGSATAVFRMKTTSDYAFSALSGNAGWERNIVLSFSTDGVWKKCVGFAVRPDGAAITNTTSTTVYGGVISANNTVWHTWTIVGRNFTTAGGVADVYLDGTIVVNGASLTGTTDSAIGSVDGLSVLAGMSGTTRDGTGSWMFDWVAYKAGVDPTWQPTIPEPGSLLALGSGLVGLMGFGIRRRK